MFGFKALLEAWRGQGLISKMFAEFEEMLVQTGKMFEISCQSCSGTIDVAAAREELRSRDKQVNKLQRSIRRQVVEHLIAKPGTDVPACLVLMSIVKDAERLGDYARALFDTAQLCCPVVKDGKYATALRDIEADVSRMMADARKALTESDEALANDVMSRESAIKAKCRQLFADLTADNLSGSESAALALMSWHFRRLTAHTANIASSVVNPIEWLDYKSKKAVTD